MSTKQTKKLKAQSAMEYLMTYGWAILIVIIVAAALWVLVLPNLSVTQPVAAGFSGFQISSGNWQVNSTGALVVIKNVNSYTVQITDMRATYGSNTWSNASQIGQLAANGQATIYLSGTGGPSTGSSYNVNVNITYTNVDNDLRGFKSPGTLTGTAV